MDRQTDTPRTNTWKEDHQTVSCGSPQVERLGALQAALVAQLVKNPPAVQDTWVWSPSWEDPLEKGTATHSSILAWRIPWTV